MTRASCPLCGSAAIVCALDPALCAERAPVRAAVLAAIPGAVRVVWATGHARVVDVHVRDERARWGVRSATARERGRVQVRETGPRLAVVNGEATWVAMEVA